MVNKIDHLKKFVRNQPSFTTEMLHNMRQAHYIKKDIRGEDYLPGFIGLANLKQTDTVNAVVQILARVVPLQTFFLQDSNKHFVNKFLEAMLCATLSWPSV